MWLSTVTLYWRWAAIAGLCAALFSCGAVWEGKRAQARLEAYQAAAEAAANKQAIHAGVITLESRKTLENVTGGLNHELGSIQAKYASYRAAHPARAAGAVDGLRVQPAETSTSSGTLPAVPGSADSVAENPAESRFIAALQGCEEIAAQLKWWQAWYAENRKNWEIKP
jgi:hypothetical protein